MSTEQMLISLVGFLVGGIGWLVKKKLEHIDETLERLVEKVGVQNGRISKLEEWTLGHEKTVSIIAQESDRRISTTEGEVKSIWQALRMVK